MNASTISNPMIPTGSRSSRNGGGGNGGSSTGSINSDAVRHINRKKDSKVKLLAGSSLLRFLSWESRLRRFFNSAILISVKAPPQWTTPLLASPVGAAEAVEAPTLPFPSMIRDPEIPRYPFA
ncbi:hypothetical protein SAY86_003335 [Trapa natans]|uniref:Uncharacterized protein n=1 Tax=Trapa natans TaxID=22666 RepID=A0AAN7M5Z8_TRANT|nr:hypothetical protein SAY86_003335 [Trapa natans]